MVYKTENTDDLVKIDGFLSSTRGNNVFQSGYYFRLNSEVSTFRPYYIVSESEGEIHGIMLVNVQNYFGSTLKKMASRAVIIGGPVTVSENPDTVREIFDFYLSSLPKEVIYTQIRNIFDTGYCRPAIEESGFKYADHLNYISDLTLSEEELWKSIYSKRKNEIRKACKEGVSVREIEYDKEFDQSFHILSLVYGKARLPHPGSEFFRNALKTGGGKFRIFGAYHGNDLIGFMYVLCYNGCVYNWYAGSINDFLKKYPNDIITWEVIKWSRRNGFSVFDFGGAGNPGKEYGVRDFKKKFGGAEVNFGRYECINRPMLMKISKSGFRLWQMIRGSK